MTAKKYCLLAKDVYASLKMEDKVDEISRKMDALDIKAGIEAAKVAEAEKAAEAEKQKEEPAGD